MIVADTNLLLHLLVRGEHTTAAQAVLERDHEWSAPPLWRSECRSALVRWLRRGDMSIPEATEVMGIAAQVLHGREYFVDSQRVFALAAASSCSTYDCEFVALATALGVPLVTSDAAVLRAFPTIAVAPGRFASG